ncbi:BadF/BadG/BcrA/BcrD ATPase family protein [Streptomyces sp. ODS28]|uniref:N-acetylglucosamine kinase n=1 Tax=Streptomyces sp. ODS28 TaxID=3136688 RepID=UPI0031E647B9
MTAHRPGGGAGGPGAWVLGVDSGGSGLRLALARAGAGPSEPPVECGSVALTEPVRTGPAGIEAAHMLEQVVPAARALLEAAGAGEPSAACVGAAGMAALGDDLRAALPGALARELGVRRTALAADAVTAYVGALGERPGAVLALGTGMIALGTDLREWRRADGWGHLLGDCGSGAWIGRAGLEAALRAYDGREGGSAALRERAEAVFGAPLSGLPAQVYPRDDRAAVLASFAPEVARCAEGGGEAGASDTGTGPDPVAVGILATAAREIAVSAAAVCPREEVGGVQPAVAATGGLLRLGDALRAPLERELAALLPGVPRVAAEGDPLHGALVVAARLSQGALRLPDGSGLLSVH